MDKSILVTWTQVIPDPNDISKWEILRSEDTGPYAKCGQLDFTSEQESYSFIDVVNVPVNSTKVVQYVVRVFDTDGNSSDSGSVSITLEMIPPDSPVITAVVLEQ